MAGNRAQVNALRRAPFENIWSQDASAPLARKSPRGQVIFAARPRPFLRRGPRGVEIHGAALAAAGYSLDTAAGHSLDAVAGYSLDAAVTGRSSRRRGRTEKNLCRQGWHRSAVSPRIRPKAAAAPGTRSAEMRCKLKLPQ